ncbi:bifunctional tetrahydrofolate synthase/dihydrofolate synthase [Legionella shakespearei]|uniref:Dihydrofolate synthase/folylpolyglutamate synthase n=1 Tax=Legionella shakespearei DSM 23087 TaxID=1122169 RepID=A0A0W0YQS8_9GAMM|nr:bifunctional tetrahydrofolate synthase/dihydrofolate synthase [Legionella shakespearei]KTD59217.1 bifunctional protein FolC [Legionella shakespearei DSM 23087]
MYKVSSKWNLDQWLHHLESRHTQEIQLELTRVLEVARNLGVNTPSCKVITVAGTNGKGSTVTALGTLYHQAGYKTASYTSPHLIRFNERIKINLTPVSDDELCHLFSTIEETRGDVILTYFEMATLAALLHFKQQKPDVIILEVGLGGRLDATNIVDADLAIITTIDFDHQDYLGDTLEAIGFEKAGILREGKPFIYADINPPASIVEVANNLNTSAYYFDKDIYVNDRGTCWDFKFLKTQFDELPKPSIQLKSASAAIAATILLANELPISQEDIKKAMQSIFIPGRLQLKRGDINVLFDVSHNAQSARLLARTIKSLDGKNTVHAVFSALKDKDLFGLIFPLKDCVDRWYPAQLDNKRASDKELLLSVFRDAETCVELCYNSPLAAFESAVNQAKSGDLIVVYGSFFTVGHVMAAHHKILEQKENQ